MMKEEEYEKKVLPQEKDLLRRWIAIRTYGLMLAAKWRGKSKAAKTMMKAELSPKKKEAHDRRVAQELRQQWYNIDVEDRKRIMQDLQYYCQLKKHTMEPYLFNKPERVPIEVYQETKVDITSLNSNHFEGGGFVLKFPTKDEICRAQAERRNQRQKEQQRWREIQRRNIGAINNREHWETLVADFNRS